MACHILLLEAFPSPGSLSAAGLLLRQNPGASIQQFAWADLSRVTAGDRLFLVREPLLRKHATYVYRSEKHAIEGLEVENLIPLLLGKKLRPFDVELFMIGPIKSKKVTSLLSFWHMAGVTLSVTFSPTGVIPFMGSFVAPTKRGLKFVTSTGYEPDKRSASYLAKADLKSLFEKDRKDMSNTPEFECGNVPVMPQMTEEDLAFRCMISYRRFYIYWLRLYSYATAHLNTGNPFLTASLTPETPEASSVEETPHHSTLVTPASSVPTTPFLQSSLNLFTFPPPP